MSRSPIVPIVFILVAIVIFFVYVSPTYSGPIAADQAQIAGYDSALAAAQTYVTTENGLAAKRDAIPAAELARLSTFLPEGDDNVQSILDLDSLAARSGISLANFTTSASAASGATDASAGAPSTNTTLGSVDLTVNATGTYAALQAFILGIENSLRLVDLVSLSVAQSDTGVYSYQMTFRLYSLH
jgi:hypothetical protein